MRRRRASSSMDGYACEIWMVNRRNMIFEASDFYASSVKKCVSRNSDISQRLVERIRWTIRLISNRDIRFFLLSM